MDLKVLFFAKGVGILGALDDGPGRHQLHERSACEEHNMEVFPFQCCYQGPFQEVNIPMNRALLPNRPTKSIAHRCAIFLCYLGCEI